MAYTSLLVLLYGAGVVWCLLMSDARPGERFTLALFWPLGPLAFVVTVAILLAASLIAYPLVMGPALIAFGVMWWLFF